MPHLFKITVQDRAGQSRELSGEFPDTEWTQLQRFLTSSFRLAECGFAESHRQLSFGIKTSAGQPVVHTATLPPERDVAEFLHRMRPFVLDREQTNFFKIRKILARRLTLPEVRTHLDRLRDLYSGKEIPFALHVNERVLTSDEGLDLWLNAFEYHQDSQKQTELEAMYRVFPEPSAKAVFLYTMLQRASAVGKLGAFIDGLAKADGTAQALRS